MISFSTNLETIRNTAGPLCRHDLRIVARCQTVCPKTPASARESGAEFAFSGKAGLARDGLAAFAGQAGDFGPALYQGVVRQGLGCVLLAFAQGVEAIGQLSHDLGLAAHLGRQNRRCAFAAGFEHTNQVVNHLPHGQSLVGGRVPVLGQLCGLE